LFVFCSSWIITVRESVPILGLALCAALCLVGLMRMHRLPLWSYPTLGIALGLLLARRGGIMASLLVLAAGFVLYEEVLDFTYGLWKTPWGIVMMAMLAARNGLCPAEHS
jgi:hypothetical protein